MDKFENKILRFIKEGVLVAPGNRVLIACSGGVDSVALLHFMASNQDKMGVEVAAIHVDHMLRGAESAADGILVEGLCEKYGIPYYGRSVPVPAILAKDGGNVQAVCRTGRYAFFSEIMQRDGYGILITAHHAEDQLETVLMQMTKGSQPLGIPVRRKMDGGFVIRPFLPVMKAELQSYVAENDLQFREDPSNASDAYMRNRFRRHIAPFLLTENPATARNVVKMSGWLQEDEDLLGMLAKERFEEIVNFTKEGLPFIDNQPFFDMHSALQRRVITLLLSYIYDGENVPVEYNSTLISQLLHHLSSQQGSVSVNLPRDYRFVREYGKLMFVQDAQLQKSSTCSVLSKGAWTQWGNDIQFYWAEMDDSSIESFTYADDVMYFEFPDSAFPLYVRKRADGDRILLPGMTHPKRLSRLFIDEKVGLTERDCLPIIVTAQGDVCAVPGLRYGVAFSENKIAGNKYIFSMRRL